MKDYAAVKKMLRAQLAGQPPAVPAAVAAPAADDKEDDE